MKKNWYYWTPYLPVIGFPLSFYYHNKSRGGTCINQVGGFHFLASAIVQAICGAGLLLYLR